ncbi:MULTISPECIES: DUF6059 family protein [unclassified Streptomyces]|uniref:DUF6059 family protein n=1 Tax=unclassified Streptomyces TaxID=2593676 RepID=UPI0036477F0D
MKRLLRAGLRAVDHCAGHLWRSLVAAGAAYAGHPACFDALQARTPAPRAAGPFARYAPGGLRLLPPGPVGPPPAHPERLCPDLPLSGAELLLARELWPAYDSGHRAPGAG